MQLDSLSKTIRLAGRIGVIVSLIFLAAIIDDFIAGYREPKNLFRAMAGTELAVNGNVDEALGTINDVVFVCHVEGLSMEFREVRGRMWRGVLKVDIYVDPGEYSFMVIPREEEPAKETPRYRVMIFKDKGNYQRSFKSLFHRYTGVSPFWITIIMIPLIMLTFGLVYYLSGKKEDLLALQGKAEIFKIKKKGTIWEIFFGLGQKHGIGQGDVVMVYDPEGAMIGRAEVTKVSKTYATAQISDIPEFTPGCTVVKY